MAKQGFFKFERTFGCFIFYRVGNRYYIRQKSRLSGRRVKTSKAFANSRASARRLAIGSCVAASVYRELPEAWKMYDLYQKLTGLAIRLQKEGKTVTEIRPLLEKQLYDWGYRKEINYPTIKPSQKPIIIRSANECKTAETENSTLQPIKQVKGVKQKTNQPIKRRIRQRVKKVKRNYNIRRNRKQVASASCCFNRKTRVRFLFEKKRTNNLGKLGSINSVMTSRSNAP